MAITTVENFMKASGATSYTDTQKAQIQYYIDTVEGYLTKLTGVTFSKIVDEPVRMKSDGLGEIVLELDPITDVSNVAEWVRSTDNEDLVNVDYCWDGFNSIRGLWAFRTYVVTLSYGLDPVPADIVGVATEAVKRGVASNPTGLKMKTVGDVSYQYGDMLDFSSDTDQKIISEYSETNTTWSLATSRDHESTSRGFRYGGFILNGPMGEFDE